MSDATAMTGSTSQIAVDEAPIAALRSTFRGELVFPGSAGYDQARRVWNGMVDKRPALIARCRGVADVMHIVNVARDHRQLVSVRGGGHNVAGLALCDGGITIDLSTMKSIRVDPVARTVRAEAGVTWGDLDRVAFADTAWDAPILEIGLFPGNT
jgi:FAD/FMN-containing dehydrogenase